MVAFRSAKVRFAKASGRLEYPNPMRKRGTIPQVPHLRIGLGLVVFTSPLA